MKTTHWFLCHLRRGRACIIRGRVGWFGLLCALGLGACGGMMEEPRIVATLPPEPAAPVTVRVDADPVLARGAQIFAERCASCHGDQGRGDGPVIRTAQIGTPPDFTQPSTMSIQGLAAIYEVVTAGRIDKMMPPWDGVLSAEDRQAVAAFVAALGGAYPAVDEAQTEAE